MSTIPVIGCGYCEKWFRDDANGRRELDLHCVIAHPDSPAAEVAVFLSSQKRGDA